MRKLRLGMVGGGQGAFIGGVHRIAARLDGQWDLVAGALSSDPEKSIASAQELGIDSQRAYTDFKEMAKAEATRTDGIDAVAIVTPNHMHADPAVTFLESGIHVICDKPLASTDQDAVRIKQAAHASNASFILTHNYTGYPMVRQAREMFLSGCLGELRLLQVEYLQDWLSHPSSPDNKQAKWRTNPNLAGAGCIGDIGTHAFNLAHFITNQLPSKLSADLTSIVDARAVDDNANVLLRYPNGARGILWASQVAVGNENGLRLRIYGDKGGLEWHQEMPNQLMFTHFGQATQVLTRGSESMTAPIAHQATRLPAGHPEGYLEAFATLYKEAAELIRGNMHMSTLLPTLNDGLIGMEFIRAAIDSSKQDSVWVPLNCS